MKIDSSVKSTTSPGAKEASARPARPAGPQPAPQNNARDEVKITSLSSQLQALENSLGSVSSVDTARVDAIKQAISDGHFKVDTSAVADRLLNTVKEMLIKQKG